jgi:hypothetical protein
LEIESGGVGSLPRIPIFKQIRGHVFRLLGLRLFRLCVFRIYFFLQPQKRSYGQRQPGEKDDKIHAAAAQMP